MLFDTLVVLLLSVESVDESGIVTIERHKLIVCTNLNDKTIFHNSNCVTLVQVLIIKRQQNSAE